MPSARKLSTEPPADIDKTSAKRFPLAHKLIHFSDLRKFYREMRDALISANRRAGAQKGLVTKAKKKIAQLENERNELISYRKDAEEQLKQFAPLLSNVEKKLSQVKQLEQSIANLADVKEAVDEQERVNSGPTQQSMADLIRSVESVLESVDEVDLFEDSIKGTDD